MVVASVEATHGKNEAHMSAIDDVQIASDDSNYYSEDESTSSDYNGKSSRLFLAVITSLPQDRQRTLTSSCPTTSLLLATCCTAAKETARSWWHSSSNQK